MPQQSIFQGFYLYWSRASKNTKAKAVMAALLLFILPIGVLHLQSISFDSRSKATQTPPNTESLKQKRLQKQCQASGGEQVAFQTTCADVCTTTSPTCQEEIVLSCDCGPERCWDGNHCRPDPTPQAPSR